MNVFWCQSVFCDKIADWRFETEGFSGTLCEYHRERDQILPGVEIIYNESNTSWYHLSRPSWIREIKPSEANRHRKGDTVYIHQGPAIYEGLIISQSRRRFSMKFFDRCSEPYSFISFNKSGKFYRDTEFWRESRWIVPTIGVKRIAVPFKKRKEY